MLRSKAKAAALLDNLNVKLGENQTLEGQLEVLTQGLAQCQTTAHSIQCPVPTDRLGAPCVLLRR